MKKILCFLLCIVFMSTALLASCNGGEDESSNTDSAGTVSGSELYKADLPEGLNFEGRTFTFLTCGVNAQHESEIVFNDYADGGEVNMSTVVNEAIDKRNKLVEAALNVKIKEIYIEDINRKNGAFAEQIRKDTAAGSGEYQAVVPCIYDGATLAAGGYLKDLNNIKYLDMTQPWWDQKFNEELTINNKLYFTVGDIGLINKAATAALMFNKALITKYNLENPYQLVKDKKWTMDKVFTMAKAISVDNDLDGTITYRDSMGWSGQLDDMWSLFYGSGEKIAKTGTDGYPTLSMYNERSAAVLDKMVTFVQDKQHYISANDYFNEAKWPATLTIKPFLEGRCLFFSGNIDITDSLDDMADDFGIVPVPMYDESQDSYHSLINPWVSTCFAVPTLIPESDLEFVGAVLQSMGAESRNYVYKAYYDVALKYQKTRDEDSVTMLDTIFESRGCDIGMIYAWGGLDTMLQSLASQTPGTFTSTYQQKEEAAKTALNDTIGYFKNVDNG